jgi:hypothetical protein
MIVQYDIKCYSHEFVYRYKEGRTSVAVDDDNYDYGDDNNDNDAPFGRPSRVTGVEISQCVR